VLILGLVWTLALALPVLALTGLGTLAFLGASNTLIQTLSPDEVRGRAISVYTMVAIGVVPAGSLVVGAIASATGLHIAFLIAGGVSLAAILGVWLMNPIIRTV
jgi:MFS family permease